MKNLDYKWQVLIVVVFGSFMVILDSTVMNVTLPTFIKIFDTDISGVQWILTSYLLSLGVTTPLAGYLADRFGIKKMYIVALGIFIIGSALCGFSQNLWMLIGFRVLQGVGGGLTVPLGTAQLFQAFPPQQRGLANGIFGVPLLVAPALGPTLGGALVQFWHWSLIFYINVPIGLIGITLALWLLKTPEKPLSKREKFDSLGFGLVVVGLGLLLLALDRAADLGWTNWLILSMTVLALIFLISFAVVELRRPNPIVDLRLFKKINFTLGNLVNWATIIALFASAFLLPLYLQNIRGATPFTIGLLLLPQAITAAIIVPFSGRLYDRIGSRVLVASGLAILTVTSFFFTRISADTSFLLIEILLGLRGIALSLALQPAVTTALSVADRAELPRASSLVNANRQVIQALSTAILSTVLATQAAGGATSSGAGAGAAGSQINVPAFINGINSAFSIVLWLTVAGLIVSFFLPGWPGKLAAKPGQAQPVAESKT